MSEMIEATADFEAPRIKDVRPGVGDYVLDVTWVDGSECRIDLTESVFRYKHLRPLRDRDRFAAVHVADWGWAVGWGEEMDLSAEALWDLAKAQALAAMTPSDFRAWLKAHGLTQDQAAALLGLSKRSIAYYSTGAKPISRTIALALKGVEAELVGNTSAARTP